MSMFLTRCADFGSLERVYTHMDISMAVPACLMNELFCFHVGMLGDKHSPCPFHSTPDMGSTRTLLRLRSVEEEARGRNAQPGG